MAHNSGARIALWVFLVASGAAWAQSVTADDDASRPTVTILSIEQGGQVRGDTRVDVVFKPAAADNVVLTRLDVAIDGTNVATIDANSGLRNLCYNWKTADWPDGRHNVEAVVTDALGRSRTYRTFAYVRNNVAPVTPPTVIPTPAAAQPREGLEVRDADGSTDGTIIKQALVRVRVDETIGAKWVVVYVNNKFFAMMNFPPYEATVRPFSANGERRVDDGPLVVQAKIFRPDNSESLLPPWEGKLDTHATRVPKGPAPVPAGPSVGAEPTVAGTRILGSPGKVRVVDPSVMPSGPVMPEPPVPSIEVQGDAPRTTNVDRVTIDTTRLGGSVGTPASRPWTSGVGPVGPVLPPTPVRIAPPAAPAGDPTAVNSHRGVGEAAVSSAGPAMGNWAPTAVPAGPLMALPMLRLTAAKTAWQLPAASGEGVLGAALMPTMSGLPSPTGLPAGSLLGTLVIGSGASSLAGLGSFGSADVALGQVHWLNPRLALPAHCESGLGQIAAIGVVPIQGWAPTGLTAAWSAPALTGSLTPRYGAAQSGWGETSVMPRVQPATTASPVTAVRGSATVLGLPAGRRLASAQTAGGVPVATVGGGLRGAASPVLASAGTAPSLGVPGNQRGWTGGGAVGGSAVRVGLGSSEPRSTGLATAPLSGLPMAGLVSPWSDRGAVVVVVVLSPSAVASPSACAQAAARLGEPSTLRAVLGQAGRAEGTRLGGVMVATGMAQSASPSLSVPRETRRFDPAERGLSAAAGSDVRTARLPSPSTDGSGGDARLTTPAQRAVQVAAVNATGRLGSPVSTRLATTPSGTRGFDKGMKYAAPPAPTPGAPVTIGPAYKPTAQVHVVVKGETLYGLSRKFGVAIEDLERTNHLNQARPLLIGQQLVVPRGVLQVNGNTITTDVAPLRTVHGVQTAPLRFVVQALGGSVSWVGPEQQVQALGKRGMITINIGSREATVGQERILMDLAAYLEGGRTMVPTRFISEEFDVTVEVDKESGSIYIRSNR